MGQDDDRSLAPKGPSIAVWRGARVYVSRRRVTRAIRAQSPLTRSVAVLQAESPCRRRTRRLTGRSARLTDLASTTPRACHLIHRPFRWIGVAAQGNFRQCGVEVKLRCHGAFRFLRRPEDVDSEVTLTGRAAGAGANRR